MELSGECSPSSVIMALGLVKNCGWGGVGDDSVFIFKVFLELYIVFFKT